MGQIFSFNNSSQIINPINSDKNNYIFTNEQTNLHTLSNKQTHQIEQTDKSNKLIQLILSNKYKIGENLEIKFKNSFNDPIDEKLIEKFRLYEGIIFGFSFNQSVMNKIPSNITFIQFGHNFNKTIGDLVIENESDNISTLILGERFNLPVDNLSPGLKKLTLGYYFNLPVDNLPNKLEYLQFGYEFNQSVDYLPCSLKYIIFGNDFNHSIDNLPSSILMIQTGQNFNCPISIIPIELKKIILSKNYCETYELLINNIVGREYIEITYC